MEIILPFIFYIAIFAFAAISLVLIPFIYRIVVPTNEVHIVQSRKSTESFGRGMTKGNVYYAWPSWIPVIGIVKSSFPLSVFDIDLAAYEAYDSGRVPFLVDIKGFFRINESAVAAERVNNFTELKEQLRAILQGSVRSILAKNDLESILQERGKFGDQFTSEVFVQLKEWGAETVKNIEFMDIRDAHNSKVIANIMEKKKSAIEKESRIEVAKNTRDAEVAEIDAKRDADVRRQDAEQQIGLRTTEKEKAVGIAQEQSKQSIQEQSKVTAEREMEVKYVKEVKDAEIKQQVAIVAAEQTQKSTVLIATGEKEKVILESDAIAAKGKAMAEAEKAMQLAPVQAQIELAKEIGSNEGYQAYLIQVETVKANRDVGMEQAKAITAANIKIIANSGDINGGVKNVMDLFTPNGGTKIGGALEAMAQTDMGKSLLSRFGIGKETGVAIDAE